MTAGRAVAIVLAAGVGSRFAGDGHKLDARIAGRPLLERSTTAALDADIGPVLVVVADDRRSAPSTPVPPSAVVVVNHRWRDGSASSLRTGLAHAAAVGADRAVVALADQPFISATAWRAVASADAALATATYQGRRGHPVLLRDELWPLVPATGDEGGAVVMRLRPHLVREIPCPGSSVDIDTVEDLRRWQNSSSTSSP